MIRQKNQYSIPSGTSRHFYLLISLDLKKETGNLNNITLYITPYNS